MLNIVQLTNANPKPETFGAFCQELGGLPNCKDGLSDWDEGTKCTESMCFIFLFSLRFVYWLLGHRHPTFEVRLGELDRKANTPQGTGSQGTGSQGIGSHGTGSHGTGSNGSSTGSNSLTPGSLAELVRLCNPFCIFCIPEDERHRQSQTHLGLAHWFFQSQS